MIIVGSCVGDGGLRFDSIVRPSLIGLLESDDLVVTESGSNGICSAYNSLIRLAREREDCELLLLIHDDVECVDPNLRPMLLNAVHGSHVGVVGVAGGTGLRSSSWWDARQTAGAVFESRGYLDIGVRSAEVDCVDGLMMAISPRAFKALEFDAERFPAFHGYDVDYCLAARSRGLTNIVVPVDVLHRTKGGYGDEEAFAAAAAALHRKWPQYIQGEPAVSARRLRLVASRAKRRIARKVPAATNALRQRANRLRGRDRALPPESHVSSAQVSVPNHLYCPVCRQGFALAPGQLVGGAIALCPACGLGVTCPPPARDVEGEGIWVQRYGDSRLQRRATWFHEAQLRVDWLKLFVPEGLVLEVGCGTGEFVAVARDNGYKAHGVEPSRWAAQAAREINTDITTGYISDWMSSSPGVRPDVVAMWHVLEHIPDPAALLDDVFSLLGPGGTLVLEVPNYASSDACALGVEWDGLQPEDHYHHFGPETLRKLLEVAGFEIRHLLEISPRVYLNGRAWNQAKNDALLQRRSWPSLDYLRAVAVVP